MALPLFDDVHADNGHSKWALDAKDCELVGGLGGFLHRLGLQGGLRLTSLLYCLLCFPLFPRGALAFLQRACCDFLCFGFLFLLLSFTGHISIPLQAEAGLHPQETLRNRFAGRASIDVPPATCRKIAEYPHCGSKAVIHGRLPPLWFA